MIPFIHYLLKVLIDGVDLKDLNLTWYRNHIGIVSQEPILFATTIAENIMFGNPNITYAEVEKAAKMANAHDFISSLPEVRYKMANAHDFISSLPEVTTRWKMITSS